MNQEEKGLKRKSSWKPKNVWNMQGKGAYSETNREDVKQNRDIETKGDDLKPKRHDLKRNGKA